MKLYLLLLVVVLTSGCVQNTGNNTIITTTTTIKATNIDQHNTTDAYSGKQDLYNSVKREIEVLYEQNPENGIGPDHYNRLQATVDSLEGFVASAELEPLRQKLETLNPEKKGSVTTTLPKCVSNTNPVFTADITDTNKTKAVTPPRNEKTHSHIWIKDGKKVPVYVPVDAKLVAGAKYTENGGLNYLFFFDASCEVEIKFDHITEPVKSIADMLPNPPKVEDTRTDYLTATQFKAGDLIGYTTGNPASNNWDFGVYNKAKLNHLNGKTGYTELDMRAGCPYDYFTPAKKQFYYSLFVGKTGDGAPPADFCKK